MVDFRYHLVSLVAVLLALATGVVLGADLLAEPASGGVAAERDRLATANRVLSARIGALQRRDGAQRQFIAEVAPSLVSGRLDDRSAVVVALPGADAEVVSGVAALLRDGGARVRGTVTLAPAAADERKAAALDDLVARVVPAGVRLPEGTAWDRLGAQLGAVLAVPAGDEDRPVSAQAATTVLTALSSAGFLSLAGDVAEGAQTAVVVGGRGPGGDAVRDGFVRLAADLDRRGAGAVVVAPAGRGSSVLDGVRRSARDAVSTVDTAQGAAAEVVAVLALADEVRGRSAHYGGDAAPAAPRLSGRLATRAAPER